MTAKPLEQTIDVAASPAEVWTLVSDLPRLAEWSPQVLRSIVRGGGPIHQGTKLLNINRQGLRVWPTRSKVVRFEPGREIAFRVKDNFTIWSLTLEETPTGTRIVQRREVPQGISGPSQRLTALFMGGAEKFTAELERGMQATLQRIKATAEAA